MDIWVKLSKLPKSLKGKGNTQKTAFGLALFLIIIGVFVCEFRGNDGKQIATVEEPTPPSTSQTFTPGINQDYEISQGSYRKENYFKPDGSLIYTERVISHHDKVYPMYDLWGVEWMGFNLRYPSKDSWCYEIENSRGRIKEFCELGRLYTHEACMNACKALGLECPKFGHWKDLLNTIAPPGLGKDGKHGFDRVAAYGLLTDPDSDRFPLSFSLSGYGRYDYLYDTKKFDDFNEVGRYWTSDYYANGGTHKYPILFEFNSDVTVKRYFTDKAGDLAHCRCINDKRPREYQPEAWHVVGLPNLQRYPLSAARTQIQIHNFTTGNIFPDSTLSNFDDYEDAYVYKQEPAFNPERRKPFNAGKPIDLFITKNKPGELTKIPDFTQSYRAYLDEHHGELKNQTGILHIAKDSLTNLGFKAKVVRDKAVQDNINIRIVKQNPAPGNFVGKGSTVELYVDYYPVLSASRFNVVGKPAIKSMKELNQFFLCYIEVLKDATDANIPSDELFVYAQSPNSERSEVFKENQRIILYAAGQKVEMSDIRGRRPSLSQLRSLLEDRGIGIRQILPFTPSSKAIIESGNYSEHSVIVERVIYPQSLPGGEPEWYGQWKHRTYLMKGQKIDVEVSTNAYNSYQVVNKSPKEEVEKEHTVKKDYYEEHELLWKPQMWAINKCFFDVDDPDRITKEKKCADKKMMRFIKRKLKYPKDAKKNDIKGTVRVSFIVEKSGIITNINIEKGLGYGCDKEAVRVIKKLPDFRAGGLESTYDYVRSKMYVNVPFYR